MSIGLGELEDSSPALPNPVSLARQIKNEPSILGLVCVPPNIG